MAKDVQDRIGQLLGSDTVRGLAGTAVTELLKGVGKQQGGVTARGGGNSDNHRGLSGVRGVAAGAGAAALAPIAVKGIGKLINNDGDDGDDGGGALSGPKKLAKGAASKVGDSVGEKVTGKIDEAGGPSGILKDTVKNALPFGGGSGGGGGKNDAQGVGKGRRMPVQQSVDIALPLETVYNQWTQFEEWPKFMHRVTRATQEDARKVSFAVKIWGKTKEFTAEIETQRPDDRIRWKTAEGMTHTGVVAFRELGPNLTRVMLSFDLDPGGLLEKYARGARFMKRAARADLHRFAAFIEMLEHETGAWRGVIEDGEVVEDHDASYDKQREYGSADELIHGRGSEDDNTEDEDDKQDRNGGDPEPQRSSRSGRRSGTRAGSRSQGSRSSRPQGARSSSRSTKASGSSKRASGSSSGGSSGGSKSRSGSSSSGGRGSRSSARSNGSGGRSSGRARSGTSRGSRPSAEHQGRQRTRSSGRG